MYTINKITSDHVADFAAEELKKYLRMMMPRCGEIEIFFSPEAKDGFRLGLMSDFGLDTSDAEDTVLDDIIYIDTDLNGGIIAGSNPRSILLAVYKYLTINGCRWLFPGIDGEYIPVKEICSVKYRKLADCRYRGQCNEGAESQQCMMETIDFSPKIGLNIYMIEFDNPKVYYNWYYDHLHNTENRTPEPVSNDTVLQWKRQCEAEISKRGLQYHDMGHGWTAESFGISSAEGWVSDFSNPIPDQSRDFIAMINGKRELYGGIALNTNFCMSNPEARKKVVENVVSYAKLNTNVDYLHVWLADAYNNHCECEECRKKIPSDWYVILMNEIDEALTRNGLFTRIVFCCYVDTTWPCETVKINNPDRFTLLLGAISRDYTTAVSKEPTNVELKPFVLNKNILPATVDEYNAYAKEWQKKCGLRVLVYEYHFWRHQFYDPSCLDLARLIYDDIIGYKKNGFDGIVEDGSQRSFFPTGFCYYVYGNTLFDNSVSFEDMKKDYFSHAFGNNCETVIGFLESISRTLRRDYLEGKLSCDIGKGRFYNPSLEKDLQSVPEITKNFEEFISAHLNSSVRAQTVSTRLLLKYIEYCNGISYALSLKCIGKDTEANKTFYDFMRNFGKYEIEIERWFDHALCVKSLSGIFGSVKAYYN